LIIPIVVKYIILGPLWDGALVVLIAYFGHHKCATRWMVSICRDIASLTGHSFADITSPNVFGKNIWNIAQERRITFLSYTNARQKKVNELLDFKGIHLIRDPRDVIVSAYFSHMNSHSSRDWKQLIAHRDRLSQLSKEDGLHAEIDFSASNIDSIAGWDYRQSNVYEMKFENLVDTPLPKMLEAVRFLGLLGHELSDTTPGAVHYYLAGRCSLWIQSMLRLRTTRPYKSITRSDLDRILRRNAFEQKANGRIRGHEDAMSHYRKGVSGDWHNHFRSQHKDHFKEKFGDLLGRLGYENNNNW